MIKKAQSKDKDLSNELIQELLNRIILSTRRMREGKVTYLIGNNGTGKSTILAKLAEQLERTRPARTVACIASSIYDKFKFKPVDTGQIRYLGARNVSNAVFHAAIDRQLSRLLLKAMLIDRGLLTRLSEAVKMDFSFSLGENLKDQVLERINLRTKQGRMREDLLTSRSLSMLERISKAGGRFESLTDPQIRVFLRYLELNIDFDLYIRLSNDLIVRFEELSTGEQNRTLLFAKILSVMEEGSVFLIDEPEISLHLHWQMKFHSTLMKLLEGLKRFHVIIATHAPIIISEAAKEDPDSRLNAVAVLRRLPVDGVLPGEEAPGGGPVTYDLHTFVEVASHEQLVLRYFQTAPYHSREVSLELADTVLGVAEGRSKLDATNFLQDLQYTVGLSDETQKQITAALDLIKRDLMLSLDGQGVV